MLIEVYPFVIVSENVVGGYEFWIPFDYIVLFA